MAEAFIGAALRAQMVGKCSANKGKSFLCGGLWILCNSSRINRLRTGPPAAWLTG
jgi:hypothetical protein